MSNIKRRSLTESDLRRMNIPKEFWTSSIHGVQLSCKCKIESLLTKIEKAHEVGLGIIIFGDPYVGKTAIASMIMKESRSLGKSGYFTTFWELRDDIKDGADFDDSETVMQRAKNADVLVLDNFRKEDVLEKYYLNIRAIEELLSFRRSKQLVTVVTTRMSQKELIGKEFSGFIDSMIGCIYIKVTGENLRVKQENTLTKEFLGGK